MTGAALTLGVVALLGILPRPVERVVERVAASPRAADDVDTAAVLAADVAPSVVTVRATTADGMVVGSGVAYRSDGHIITNDHLVAGSTAIDVLLADGATRPAKLIGSDPDTDLAVLSIAGAAIRVATLGSGRDLRVGQLAVAVGASDGARWSPAVSAGVIAGVGRAVAIGDHWLYDLIATDATVVPRLSGGALVDRRGSVVGITTTMSASDQALAVPIDIATRVADELVRTGKVGHAWIGLQGNDLDPETAREYGAPGILVHDVAKGGPADRSGIGPQDVVTAIGGEHVGTMTELLALLRRHTPGDRVPVTILRSGKARTVEVALTDRPS
jgi:S1-C subfamily serine protease